MSDWSNRYSHHFIREWEIYSRASHSNNMYVTIEGCTPSVLIRSATDAPCQTALVSHNILIRKRSYTFLLPSSNDFSICQSDLCRESFSEHPSIVSSFSSSRELLLANQSSDGILSDAVLLLEDVCLLMMKCWTLSRWGHISAASSVICWWSVKSLSRRGFVSAASSVIVSRRRVILISVIIIPSSNVNYSSTIWWATVKRSILKNHRLFFDSSRFWRSHRLFFDSSRFWSRSWRSRRRLFFKSRLSRDSTRFLFLESHLRTLFCDTMSRRRSILFFDTNRFWGQPLCLYYSTRRRFGSFATQCHRNLFYHQTRCTHLASHIDHDRHLSIVCRCTQLHDAFVSLDVLFWIWKKNWKVKTRNSNFKTDGWWEAQNLQKSASVELGGFSVGFKKL